MRSPSPDLTTRARIRDAALALFGAQGFTGTSVRAIA
ncbi:MAG: TetR family transcriptional regulator, partial [Microcella sp.]|nr:TetR family transcriptional regulator [Microcella sp.]